MQPIFVFWQCASGTPVAIDGHHSNFGPFGSDSVRIREKKRLLNLVLILTEPFRVIIQVVLNHFEGF